MRRVQLCGVDDADPCSTESGNHVHEDLNLVRLDAGQSRGLLVAADCQYVPSERNLFQKNCSDRRKNDKHVHAGGNSEEITAKCLESGVSKRFIAVQLGECGAAGAKVRKTAADVHGTQRSDERRNPELCHDQTIYSTNQNSKDTHDHDDGRNAEVQRL